MAKNITIEYCGKEYTLEFTLVTVKKMEVAGFNVREVLEKPANYTETLFTGAFLEHHPDAIRKDIPTKIMKDNNGIPKAMFSVLVEMYNDVLNGLLYDDDEEREVEPEKKLDWAKNF